MSMWTLSCGYFFTTYILYDLAQVTKDYRLAKVSGPLTYSDISTASSEGRKDIWTERERDWDEAEATDTGQTRPPQMLLVLEKRTGVLVGPGVF